MNSVPTMTDAHNDRQVCISDPNAAGDRLAPDWPNPAPQWATYAAVWGGDGDPTMHSVEWAAEKPAPWHAHVERTDFREGDAEPAYIRVLGGPDVPGESEDITTPHQARELAASLWRAAIVLEGIQGHNALPPGLGRIADPELPAFTPCPSWCVGTGHDMGTTPDGDDLCEHSTAVIESGAGPAAWVSRIDTRRPDGTIAIGEIQVGANLECSPTLEPASAGAVAAMLFTVGMQVKRLRGEDAADVE
ncbi:hypothetical protein [Clavibacter michiganensis]|uniref:hypothetical protein n=1 Tax=Clavibacter michiganensis TaxID=28447 RepID=UPI003EB8F245